MGWGPPDTVIKLIRDGYARHDTFAEAGDDGSKLGGTKEADEASEVEYATLRDLMLFPCTTAIELQDKIAQMRKRGPLTEDQLCWGDDVLRMLDRMEMDLINISRPNASPEIARAFNAWADAWEHFYALGNEGNDPELEKRGEAVSALRHALICLPCTAPGDFIVKAFAELLAELGGDPDNCFLPQLQHTDRYDEMVWRDIRDSDLGCCMAALGRADFDAQRWVHAAKRVGKKVCVVITEGKRSLQFGEPFGDGEDSIAHLLQRLTANGLRQLSTDRCIRIADEIEDNHADLVIDTRVLEAV